MQYRCAGPDASLLLAPLGKAEGNRCNIEPFRNLLTVAPSEETTKHRFPAGLANTNLKKTNSNEKNIICSCKKTVTLQTDRGTPWI